MAFKNKTISNSRTKQDIRFLQTARDTNGQLLEMESTYNAHSREPTPHYHPHQEEDFTVISGELTIRIDGRLRTLKAGDAIHISRNQIHAMWNAADAQTVVNWKVRPALNMDYLLETMTGLANDGKTDENGMPGILQIAMVADKYSKTLRLSKPPYPVQKIVFTILKPFAWLCGYRSSYRQYLD
jgi:quercetin dioxygenase-like cupin family protein